MSLRVLETTVRDGTVYERFLTDMDGGAHFKVTRMTAGGKDIPVGSMDVVVAADVRWYAADILVPAATASRIMEAKIDACLASGKPGIDDSEFYEQEGRYAALHEVLTAMGYKDAVVPNAERGAA